MKERSPAPRCRAFLLLISYLLLRIDCHAANELLMPGKLARSGLPLVAAVRSPCNGQSSWSHVCALKDMSSDAHESPRVRAFDLGEASPVELIGETPFTGCERRC